MKKEPTMGDYKAALELDPAIDPPVGDLDVVDLEDNDPELGDVDNVLE